MRHKIFQLKRIRTLRTEQRQRDWVNAKDALEQAENHKRQLEQEKVDVLKDIRHRASYVAGEKEGELATALTIEHRLKAVDQLKAYAAQLDQRIEEASQAIIERQEDVENAYRAFREAQKAVDQIGVLEERVIEDETREADRLEEMNEEPRPKPAMNFDG